MSTHWYLLEKMAGEKQRMMELEAERLRLVALSKPAKPAWTVRLGFGLGRILVAAGIYLTRRFGTDLPEMTWDGESAVDG